MEPEMVYVPWFLLCSGMLSVQPSIHQVCKSMLSATLVINLLVLFTSGLSAGFFHTVGNVSKRPGERQGSVQQSSKSSRSDGYCLY